MSSGLLEIVAERVTLISDGTSKYSSNAVQVTSPDAGSTLKMNISVVSYFSERSLLLPEISFKILGVHVSYFIRDSVAFGRDDGAGISSVVSVDFLHVS